MFGYFPTNYHVILVRRAVTLKNTKTPGIFTDRAKNITVFWTFKEGACRCKEQVLTTPCLRWTKAKLFSGYDEELYTHVKCLHCGYEEEFVPATILAEDLFKLIAKKIEVIQTQKVCLQDLQPVYRLVQKTEGKNSYYTTEELFGLDRLRYYYPGKEYRPIPPTPVPQPEEPLELKA